jgi:thiamine-phosphate pyrophosphorylase
VSRRHPSKLPPLWLMTDERMGEDLWRALQTLPPGSGVIFRHHATPLAGRRALFAKVGKIARARRLLLVRAGPIRLGREQGVHGKGAIRPGQIRTWPAHTRKEALTGINAGADLLFVSPIFATRSHPGAAASGPVRAAIRICGLTTPAIALGGMTARRYRRLRLFGFYGWAAIDAWIVPRG